MKMNRVYFSIIRRYEDPNAIGNEHARIYKLDYASDNSMPTAKDIPISKYMGDGRSRGIRGMEFFQDHIWISTTGTAELLKLDPDTLDIIQSFSLKEMIGD